MCLHTLYFLSRPKSSIRFSEQTNKHIFVCQTAFCRYSIIQNKTNVSMGKYIKQSIKSCQKQSSVSERNAFSHYKRTEGVQQCVVKKSYQI